MYPETAEITPGVLWKLASTPQKHPSANVAFAMALFYSGLRNRSTEQQKCILALDAKTIMQDTEVVRRIQKLRYSVRNGAVCLLP